MCRTRRVIKCRNARPNRKYLIFAYVKFNDDTRDVFILRNALGLNSYDKDRVFSLKKKKTTTYNLLYICIKNAARVRKGGKKKAKKGRRELTAKCRM